MPAHPEKDEKQLLNELFQPKEESTIVVEDEPKIEKEVERYFEKVEKEQYLTQPITDDAGQPLVSPPAPQQPQIVLPLTEVKYQFGLSQKVTDSIRWLSEWCLRLVKIFGSRAVFRKTDGKI